MLSKEIPVKDLMELVCKIVAFYMKNNAEPDAVDLLIEVDYLRELVKHTDKTNYERTCLYLTSSARYLEGHGNDKLVLFWACWIYQKFGDCTNALRTALFLGYYSRYVTDIFISCDDVLHKKQCCFILARLGITFKLDDTVADDNEEREILQGIINNSELSERYLTLARDIGVMEPKSPEDIYTAHYFDGRTTAGVNAATFVNAFVNAGFGQDKLMTVPCDPSCSGSSGNWLFKNKEHGKTSAVASLGMIFLWDFRSGFKQILNYLVDDDYHVQAGALLGIGILNCGIKHDDDPRSLDSAMGILPCAAYTAEEPLIRIGAIMALGIAYAGSQNVPLRHQLVWTLNNETSEDVIIFSAISLGLIYMGSCYKEIAETIVLALSDRSEFELEEPLTRLLPLAIGLLYLGRQKYVEILPPEFFHENIRDYAFMTLQSCAYAGTGDVLKVQYLLAHCSQHPDGSQVHQGPAVLGIAMIAMAEELGVDMAIRTLNHLLHYGEQNIRRAVPLALGLLCVSNPKANVMDTLSILSHDANFEVAAGAVISLGLIGAGTNNRRIAGMLRNLSSYYYGHRFLLFWVRIAQGLLYMGKGLLTLNPFQSDRYLLSQTALAGLLVVLHACLDMRALVGKYQYVLYFLVLAMQPRMLMTVDENLEPLSVPVRVGKAVDVVAQAGRPKTITGFTSFSTPVILAAGERAELATEKYIPISPILEGVVILKENPDYREE